MKTLLYFWLFLSFCIANVIAGDNIDNPYEEYNNELIDVYDLATSRVHQFYDPMNTDGIGPKLGDYILHDSNYNYDSFLDSQLPHLSSPFKETVFLGDGINRLNLGKISGSKAGARCNYLFNSVDDELNLFELFKSDKPGTSRASNCQNGGEFCQCDPGLKCEGRTTSGTQRALDNAVTPKICPFFKDCPKEEMKPNLKCIAETNRDLTICPRSSSKCLQMKHCVEGSFLTGEANLQEILCENDFNCSSGYCTEVTNSIKQFINTELDRNYFDLNVTQKICMPYKTCSPPCSEEGEVVSSGGSCCPGLSLSKNENSNEYVCYNHVKILEEIPSEIVMEMDSDTCAVVINEKIDGRNVYEGSCDVAGAYTRQACLSLGGEWVSGNAAYTVNEKKDIFERYFHGINWLWSEVEDGDGDGDGVGDGDYFETDYQAKGIRKILNSFLAESENEILKSFKAIEEKRQKYLAETLSGIGDASGEFSFRLLSDLSESQSSSAKIKMDGFLKLLGIDINGLNDWWILNLMISDIPDIDSNGEKTISFAKYREITLFPKFEYRKKNKLCGSKTVNHECKKMQLLIEYTIDGEFFHSLYDPLVPKSFYDSSLSLLDYNEYLFDYLLSSIIHSSFAGGGGYAINDYKPGDLNEEFHKKPELLNSRIYKALSLNSNNFDYHEDIDSGGELPRGDILRSALPLERVERADHDRLYDPKNLSYRLKYVMSDEEIKRLIRSEKPELNEEELGKIIESLSVDMKREITQQLIADQMNYHLLHFHKNVYQNATDDEWAFALYVIPYVKKGRAYVNRYSYDAKALHLNKMMLMAGYLARYYAAEETVSDERSECFTGKANDIKNALSEESEASLQSGDGGGSSINKNRSKVGSKNNGNNAFSGDKRVGSNIGNNLNLDLGESGVTNNDPSKSSIESTESNSSGNNSTSNSKDNSKDKLNAIFTAKKKAKKSFLDKIGIKPEEKKFSPSHELAEKIKKAFPPAKAIEKVLNRNGINLSGTKTAAVKFNEKEIEGAALTELPEIEYEEVVEVEGGNYGRRNYGDSSSSRQGSTASKEQTSFLKNVKENKNRLKDKEANTLWEKLSKSYLLIGVPRLLDSK